MEKLDAILPNYSAMDGCGKTMVYVWGALKGDSVQSCTKYHYRRGQFEKLSLAEEFNTIGAYIDEMPDYTNHVKLDNFNIDTLINLILETIKTHNTIGIELEPFCNAESHCFILTSIDGELYIIDSYIDVRGPSYRKFNLLELKQLLEYPDVDLYNKVFMCNEDAEDTFFMAEMGEYITILY